MPTRPPREPFNALVLAALAVVVTGVVIAAGGGSKGVVQQGEPSWPGLAGAQRPRVAVGQRVIVLLKAPALADRVGRVGGLATDEEERRWMQTALSSQKLLVARLRLEGVIVQPEFSYTRTVNGFSAAFDARGIALLERAPEVAGVYPVRAAYPASLSSRLLTSSEFGERPTIGLSDKDGRGVRSRPSGARRRGCDTPRHTRRPPGRERRPCGAGVRQHLGPRRVAGGVDGRGGRSSAAFRTGACRAARRTSSRARRHESTCR